MEKNNNFYKTTIAPALVLIIICLVVTAALAGTYGVANPIIQENAQKTADEARAQVDAMMNYIMQILGLCVNGADPMTCEPEQAHEHSCDGACGSCGGCH